MVLVALKRVRLSDEKIARHEKREDVDYDAIIFCDLEDGSEIMVPLYKSNSQTNGLKDIIDVTEAYYNEYNSIPHLYVFHPTEGDLQGVLATGSEIDTIKKIT